MVVEASIVPSQACHLDSNYHSNHHVINMTHGHDQTPEWLGGCSLQHVAIPHGVRVHLQAPKKLPKLLVLS